MVSKDKSSEQIDADILQCKADILRSRDIVPLYDKKGCESSPLQHTDENTNRPAASTEPPTANPAKICEDTAPIPIEATKPPMVTTVNHKPAVTRGEPACPELVERVEPTNQHGNPEIPKFNLANDIMAEQRRITAIKRKAPGKRIEVVSALSVTGSVASTSPLQWLKQPVQEQIIVEIVARDIEKLCRGNILVTGNRSKADDNNQ
jgi:hypothetical protein